MITSRTQVAIIGAGPTGLFLAAQFVRHGVDFILIDKKEKTTELSKAMVVQARTLEIYKELGIIEEAFRRGQDTTALKLFFKGKQQTSIDLKDIGNGLSEFPFALSLEQSRNEEILYQYIRDRSKEVYWNSDFISLQQDADGVLVEFEAGGETRQVEAEYLVACDGAASPVRHQLQLAFEGTTEPKLFYVADAELDSKEIHENALYMFMIQKGFALFLPMEGAGHYRVIGVLPDHDKQKEGYVFDDIEEQLKKDVVVPVAFKKVKWFSSYKVHSRKASAFREGRCFLAGDAAHIHTPAGGQGMNTGLQDSYNLAWKIAYRLRGEVNDDVLASYDTERSGNAGRLLKTTDTAFDIMSGSNRFWNAVRLALFPLFIKLIVKNGFIRKKFFPIISQTGIRYANSYLTVKSSIEKVKSGVRMPYFTLVDGTSILDRLADPTFKLLYFGKKQMQHPLEGVKQKLAFLSFNEIPANLFGDATDFYILLRPDNHISYIGKDIDQCRMFLAKIAAF